MKTRIYVKTKDGKYITDYNSSIIPRIGESVDVSYADSVVVKIIHHVSENVLAQDKVTLVVDGIG